jgi:predicted nuclease of predicted toxin-antitoxin system
MKFLVDAHLPKRLARLLHQFGYDTRHTLDLPEQNRTSDETINQVALDEGRIVVTKDSDFVDSFLLVRKPPRLLLVSTGNISNQALERLLLDNIEQLRLGFATYDYIELSRQHVIFHL